MGRRPGFALPRLGSRAGQRRIGFGPCSRAPPHAPSSSPRRPAPRAGAPRECEGEEKRTGLQYSKSVQDCSTGVTGRDCAVGQGGGGGGARIAEERGWLRGEKTDEFSIFLETRRRDIEADAEKVGAREERGCLRKRGVVG